MKSFFKTLVLAPLCIGLLTTVIAAEKDMEKTITGKAVCAKCALNKADSCQTVILETAKVNGIEETKSYQLAANDVAKKFHSKICSGDPLKVIAKGQVKMEGEKENQKRILTAVSIMESKDKS